MYEGYSEIVNVRDYQRYAAQFQNKLEVIGGCLYDTQTYVSAATTALNFFNTVPANTSIGNMRLASVLPAGEAFLVRAIRFMIMIHPYVSARVATGGIATGIMNDICLLINTSWLNLTISAKPYAQFPVWMLPAGGGVFGTLGTDGDAASPGEIVCWGQNGEPVVDNVFSLTKPIFIGSQINFVATVTWAAAVTLVHGNTNVKVVLDGDNLRPVQ